MDKKKKDIRRILLGNCYLDEENRLVPTTNVLRNLSSAYGRGADVLRILGMKEQHYSLRGVTREAAEEAMLSIGWPCVLPESPETFAAIRRGVLLFPVLMTLDTEGEQMTLGLYTARSVLCRVNLQRILKKLQEEAPKLRAIALQEKPQKDEKEA